MRFFSYLIFVSTVLSCEESKKIDMPLKKATIQKETTVKQLDLNATGNFQFSIDRSSTILYNQIRPESKFSFENETLITSLVFNQTSSLFLEIRDKNILLAKQYSLKDGYSKITFIYEHEMYISLDGTIKITKVDLQNGSMFFETSCKLKNIKQLDQHKSKIIHLSANFSGQNLKIEDIKKTKNTLLSVF